MVTARKTRTSVASFDLPSDLEKVSYRQRATCQETWSFVLVRAMASGVEVCTLYAWSYAGCELRTWSVGLVQAGMNIGANRNHNQIRGVLAVQDTSASIVGGRV